MDLLAGIGHESKHIYALQFQPDHELTLCGPRLLNNFLSEICGIPKNYDIECREAEALAYIKRMFGTSKLALVFITGGLRSVMTYKMIEKAIGPGRVAGVYVDTGLNRLNDHKLTRLILQHLRCRHSYSDDSEFFTNFNSSNHFGTAVCMPVALTAEDKRNAMEKGFQNAKNRFMLKYRMDQTRMIVPQLDLRSDDLYPDFTSSRRIRNHLTENRVSVNHTGFQVFPLRAFYRDELQELAKKYELPNVFVKCHPFPSTAFLNRIICADGPYFDSDFESVQDRVAGICDIWRWTGDENNSDADFKKLSTLEYDYLLAANCDVEATVVPMKVAGFVNGYRVDGYLVTLSTDMQPIPWEFLAFCAKILPKLVPSVTRVVFAFGGKIEHPLEDLTETSISRATVRKIQQAHSVAHNVLDARQGDGTPYPGLKSCFRLIECMPVILLPIHFDRPEFQFATRNWCVCLRPVVKTRSEIKPAVPNIHIPEVTVMAMAERVKHTVTYINRVLYDLTPCPPGNIEWE